MVKGLFGCVLCFVVATAAAQTFPEEYRPFDRAEEVQPMLQTDSTLFFGAILAAPNLYDACTTFTLPQVARQRRGRSFFDETATLEGIGLPYRSFQVLRLLGADERFVPGLAAAGPWGGATDGLRSFEFSDAVPLLPYRASVRFSGRNYLIGARFAASGEWGSGWSYTAATDLRLGQDLYVDGVFTDAATLAFRIARQLSDSQRLSLLVVAPSSVRGTRLASTQEAFTLTGDCLYNPAWGFQDGKVRNSRVRRETVPMLVASYRGQLSPATSLSASASVEAGVIKYSSLGWYNARTPQPDNYRNMPSFAGDRDTDEAWRTRDARYTQIDWDYLVTLNRLAGGHAVYALEDRAGRLWNLQLAAGFTTLLSKRLTLDYGLSVRRESTRSYKLMRDLLGAACIDDIDQYLIDDDTYGNLLQNDLRHPDRRIGEGDRFGYDYAIVCRDARLRLHAVYRADRLRVDITAEAGEASVFRRGYMEKELFPGMRSFGRSRKLHFLPGSLKAAVGWAFSPRSRLEAAVGAGASLPDPESFFCQPLYNNRTIDNPCTRRFYSAEVDYRLSTPLLDLQATTFVTAYYDIAQTRRFFDDLSGLYCDATASGIARLIAGCELSAIIRLSRRWRLSLAASGADFRYLRNASVSVISDSDNTAVDTRAESYLGNCRPGGAPLTTACAEVAWFGPKGWGARLSAGYAGLRWVEPSMVRRTGRILRQSGITTEAFDEFIHQERLPDAFTADASLFKTFYLANARLTLSLAAHNLAGTTTIYDGYESSRVRRITAGDEIFYWPHATRYTYAYPRTFYLTASFRF